MVYGEDSIVKTDLGLGAAFDARLADWNDKATEEWDDMLYEVASKRRLLITLPVLPLQTSEITESDRDGTNNLMKAIYFDNQKQFELSKGFRDRAMAIAGNRIGRIKVDKEIYGRIIR